MLKKKLYVHQNIPYAFNWNKIHHKEKFAQITTNIEELKKLKAHFKRIYEGIIPNNLFNSRNLPRVSQFKIKGIKTTFIRSFSKKLIRSGKILAYDSNSKLPKYAQKVFNNYKENKIPGYPGHEPILKNILIKDKDSIAIEIPIWNEKGDKTITGHIDLLQIENNTVKVIDYKPEGNFLLSLPQVAMYGHILKSNLGIKNLKCISFNKEGAWEYEPVILVSEIKDYLISHRISQRPWENYM
ncbi:MAG: hypothetical protein ACXABO_06770 [Promethearchaeota archaeon]|jgi:hypothetical protein